MAQQYIMPNDHHFSLVSFVREFYHSKRKQNYDTGSKDEVLLSEKRSISLTVAEQRDEKWDSQCLTILPHSVQEAQILNE